MNFELPSLPKGVVINSALITAILLGAIIAMVGFWTFLPLFMEPVPEKQAPSLAVNFSYLKTVSPGMDWNINGTARNPSNESLNNIKVRVFSDGNVEGYEFVIPTLAAGEKKDFTLYPKIKPSAAMGKFTVQTIVSVPDTFPAEYALNISITSQLQQAPSQITVAGLAAKYDAQKRTGLKYAVNSTEGYLVNTFKANMHKTVGTSKEGQHMTILFNGTTTYIILNGTAYSFGEGDNSSYDLDILPSARIIGEDLVDGKSATILEQDWDDKKFGGGVDKMHAKLWYWTEKGVPLKAEMYRNGELEDTKTASGFVFGGIADSEFELPPGMPIKPFLQFS